MFSNANRAPDVKMQARILAKPFSRRRLVTGAGAGLAAIAAPGLIRIAAAQSWRAGNPFSLGVASGSPRSDGFVLWTRLAPEALSSNPETPGGMSGADVTLRYEIATDPGMTKIVRRGAATAEAAFAHSVHLDIAGLQAGRSYWYRFLSGDAISPTGRAITLPVADSALAKLRFGFVSCSNYEHGYFSAYRHLAGENPEFVLFLGDYIYETIEQYRPIVRRHSDGIEAATLPTYRNRYAQYRLDADLQELHAQVPAIVTWDDHGRRASGDQCQLPGAARSRPHHAGLWPGGLALRRARAQQSAVEFDRPGRADGATAPQAGRHRRVLDRRLERLSRQSRTAVTAHPRQQGPQSRGHFRRHSFLLGQRSQA
jgi:hypothetical protein